MVNQDRRPVVNCNGLAVLTRLVNKNVSSGKKPNYFIFKRTSSFNRGRCFLIIAQIIVGSTASYVWIRRLRKPTIFRAFTRVDSGWIVAKVGCHPKNSVYASSMFFTSFSVMVANSFSFALWENLPLFCAKNLINSATVLSGI